ncbi:hypothetical protein QAD02_011614 [Eretmocerus hayati]|uniref:Uncharacterized protein n=1 Tax=Eretmocerus hayati TaxID=131215 RepID=A0ACC2NY96_9HYME|nr:hypothetical protein QAD02_011614 [Eretmocerus hayati]
MMNDVHNNFFYANACHVCKSLGNESNLKKCANCKMIFYCGKEHQKQHWAKHRDLCRVITQNLNETNRSYPLEGYQNTSITDWVKAKMNLMLVVSIKMGRKLLPFEQEMFKFPKACAVCHETDQKLLGDCPLCPCASFCEEHKKDSTHASCCQELGFCFDLDLASSVFIRQPPRNVVPFHTEMAYLPASMKKFIDLYMNYDYSLLVSTDIQAAHTSEYLTRPLSLIWALERLEYGSGSTMTIHVIGANAIELDGVEVWEILLHWLPTLTSLHIIMIGPELDSDDKKKECRVCECCADKKNKLYLEKVNTLYREYTSSKRYKKPNIIVGYNLGLHECENIDSPDDLWAQSIRILPEQECPFVFTSYTLEEAQKEHRRVCDILGKNISYLCCEKNKFSSMRPHRDYETEGIFYQNQFITIYRSLSEI